MGWIRDTFGNKLDTHGQPDQRFRRDAVHDRQIDELIGIVKGVLADGAVHQDEIEFLLSWLNTNRAVADHWPAKVIYPRIVSALADGFLDEREESEILDLLLGTVGGNTAIRAGEASNSTTLPLCRPAPIITFEGKIFCFTGKFNSGTRDWCCDAVQIRGGAPTNSVTRKLNYLVIGDIGSRDWLHSTHGLKIGKAIEYRDKGVDLAIISEQHWVQHLT